MTRTVLTILAALTLLFGAAGVTIVSAQGSQPGELSYALRMSNQQMIQGSAEQPIQEKEQVGGNIGQLETNPGLQDRDRIQDQKRDQSCLETGDMLQTQTLLRDQDRIHQSQDWVIGNPDPGFNTAPGQQADTDQAGGSGPHSDGKGNRP